MLPIKHIRKMTDSITDEYLDYLDKKGKNKDKGDKFEENTICLECGSKNVISC